MIRQDMAVFFFEHIKNDRNSPSDDEAKGSNIKQGKYFLVNSICKLYSH